MTPVQAIAVREGIASPSPHLFVPVTQGSELFGGEPLNFPHGRHVFLPGLCHAQTNELLAQIVTHIPHYPTSNPATGRIQMCDISLPAGHACGECGIPATVAFGQFAGETRYTCDDHDPLRPPFGAVVNIPSGYHYSKMTAPLAAPPLAAVWPSVEHFTVGGSVSTNIHFAV